LLDLETKKGPLLAFVQGGGGGLVEYSTQDYFEVWQVMPFRTITSCPKKPARLVSRNKKSTI